VTAPRIVDAIAAVHAVLEKRERPRREIVAALEGVDPEPDDWWYVVVARDFDEEWSLYLVWPEGDESAPASQYDYVERGMVVRDQGNALSQPEALFQALGMVTGIIP